MLWLSLCYWLIPLVLLLSCGPQSTELCKWNHVWWLTILISMLFSFSHRVFCCVWVCVRLIHCHTQRDRHSSLVSTSGSVFSDPWPRCLVQNLASALSLHLNGHSLKLLLSRVRTRPKKFSIRWIVSFLLHSCVQSSVESGWVDGSGGRGLTSVTGTCVLKASGGRDRDNVKWFHSVWRRKRHRK